MNKAYGKSTQGARRGRSGNAAPAATPLQGWRNKKFGGIETAAPAVGRSLVRATVSTTGDGIQP